MTGDKTETAMYLQTVPNSKYDRYGFKITEKPGVSSSKSRGESNLAPQQVVKLKEEIDPTTKALRVRKWSKMLGSKGDRLPAYKESKYRKLKRRVRKGIPPQYRGMVWFLLSGIHEAFILLWQAPGSLPQSIVECLFH